MEIEDLIGFAPVTQIASISIRGKLLKRLEVTNYYYPAPHQIYAIYGSDEYDSNGESNFRIFRTTSFAQAIEIYNDL